MSVDGDDRSEGDDDRPAGRDGTSGGHDGRSEGGATRSGVAGGQSARTDSRSEGGDGGSGKTAGRRPSSALIAVCGLLAVVLLAGALPGVSSPLGADGGDALIELEGDGGTWADGHGVVDPDDDSGESDDSGDGGEEGDESEDGEPEADDEPGEEEAPDDGEPDGDGEPDDRAGDDEPSEGGSPEGLLAPEERRIDGSAEYAAADEEVRFVVTADRPSYWRTTAYDEYHGDSWRRSDGVDADGRVPMLGDREALRHEVTFHRSSRVIPTAWRPVSAASGTGDLEYSRDPAGGFHLEEPARAGETVVVESVLPVTDGATLSNAGTDYPAEIEARYTALPEDVPDRVHEKTAEITADADTPHETAVTIERWLRANHGYALDVPPPEGDIADEILFERDEAYCAYFATTMTVMLRSEGIPARYVVGYNSGEYVGDDEYVVRGMHAHAWVEVYYPGVGWVPFEPTPPDERADALEELADEPPAAEEFDAGERDEEPPVDEDEQDADEEDERDEASDEEDERDEAADEDEDERDEAADGDEQESTIELGLEGDPVPGTELTVRVTRDGEPMADVWVTFDGEPIGRTDEDGRATGTVPYVAELEIGVEGTGLGAAGAARLDGAFFRVDEFDRAAGNVTKSVGLPTEADLEVEGEPLPGGELTVVATVEDVPVTDAVVTVDGEPVAETDANGTATVTLPAAETTTIGVERGALEGELVLELPTELDLALEGEPLPTGELTVVATLEGSPVPDAAVAVDGEPAGETDDRGAATVTLPEPGNVTITAERGVLEGERVVEVPAAVFALETGPVSLPYRTAEASVEVDGEPLEGVAVLVDDETVATTDSNGTASITLPAALSTTVAAGEQGQLGSSTAYPLTNALAGVGALVVASLGVKRVARRRGLTLGWLASLPVVACRRALTAILLVSRRADRLLEALAAGVRKALSGVDGAVEALSGAVTRLRLAGAALLGLLSLEALRSIGRRLRARGAAGSRSRVSGESARAAAGGDDPAADERTAVEMIREAWYGLVSTVPLSRPETRTPAEIADRAVEVGLPADAVETVLEAFRSVEYGNREPESTVVDRVRESIGRLRETDGETR